MLPNEDPIEKVKDLTFPLMIKPVSEGSSFGMSKVSNNEELVKAVEDARKYNAEILIEKTGLLCSYYAEKGGVIIGYEK